MSHIRWDTMQMVPLSSQQSQITKSLGKRAETSTCHTQQIPQTCHSRPASLLMGFSRKFLVQFLGRKDGVKFRMPRRMLIYGHGFS